MWKFFLLFALAFAQVDIERSFTCQKGLQVGTLKLEAPFEASMSVTLNKKPSGTANLLSLGSVSISVQSSGKVVASIAGQATTGSVLAVGKSTEVSLMVGRNRATLFVGAKMIEIKLKAAWKDGAETGVYAGSASAAAASATITGLEVFNNLPPVFTQCIKLKTMAAAKLAELKGEQTAAEKALPGLKATLSAQTNNRNDLNGLLKLCDELKTMAHKTVDALRKLIAGFKDQCEKAIEKAKKDIASTEGRIGQCKSQIKELNLYKVECECADLKEAHAGPIAKAKQSSLDESNMIESYKLAIKMLEDQVKALTASIDTVKKTITHASIRDSMVKLYTTQQTMCNDQKAEFEKKIGECNATIQKNTAYINKYEKEIKDCFDEVEKLRKNLAFLFEDERLMARIDSLEYFDEMEDLELWADNADIGMELEMEEAEQLQFQSEEDEEVEEPESISYGLIGGMGVLTSGLVYYAYQKYDA